MRLPDLIVGHLADAVTVSRIPAAFALLVTEPFSAAFYGCYVYCGVTDMVDGPIARKTHTAGRTGEILDSAADFIFAGCCLIKLLPVFRLPLWLWIWAAVLAAIRAVNLIAGYVRRHRAVLLHTAANKAAGFLRFLLPLVCPASAIERMAAVVGAIATFAAVQEGHLIRTGRDETGCRHS